jgi:hypothetical protein
MEDRCFEVVSQDLKRLWRNTKTWNSESTCKYGFHGFLMARSAGFVPSVVHEFRDSHEIMPEFVASSDSGNNQSAVMPAALIESTLEVLRVWDCIQASKLLLQVETNLFPTISITRTGLSMSILLGD